MNKWTLLASLAFLAVIGGGYYLLSQRQDRPSAVNGAGDLDVEDFDAEEGLDSDKSDNTYDMLDDNDQAGTSTPKAAGPAGAAAKGVETIDDEEEQGQTVRDPVVIEDNDEENVDLNKPKK